MKNREKEINLLDMILYICQRWRILIICLLIGTVALGLYGGYKNMKATSLSEAETEMPLIDSISNERLEIVESTANQILIYQELRNKQVEYNKETLLMSLDPFNVAYGQLNYYIDNNQQHEWNNKLFGILKSYRDVVASLDLKETLFNEEETSSDVNDNYYRDLVSCSIENNGILNISIYGDSIETVELIKKVIKKEINSKVEYINGNIDTHTITIITDKVSMSYREDLRDKQRNNTYSVVDYNSTINNLMNMFADPNEKAYLDWLILDNDEKILKKDKVVVEKPKFTLSLKYIVLGALLGLIIVAIILALKYAITKTIKTVYDLEDGFGFQILGVFDKETKFDKKYKTKFDKVLRKARKKNKYKLAFDENVELTATKVQIAAEKMNLSNICLITDIEDNNDLMDKIVEKLNGKVNATVIKNVLAKADALQDMAKMDGAVLVEQVEASKDKDIQEECLLCSKYGINIIGAIVLE